MRALGQVAAIWTLSDTGYYFVLPRLGVQANYNVSPIAVALYYGVWLAIALVAFRPLYVTWPQYARWKWFEHRLASYMTWSIAVGVPLLFVIYVLPMLPHISWTKSWNPPEIRVATSWYFLPKAVEILFQQLLIVALVLALAGRHIRASRISAYSAFVFGGAHVLLAFGGVPIGYVLRFMLAAAVFGFMFPYFLLRIRNGLAYSYMVQWLYYIATVMMPHLFWSATK